MIQENGKKKPERALQKISNAVRTMLHMNRGSVVYGVFGSSDGLKGINDNEDDVKVYVKHKAYNITFDLAQTGKDIPNNLE